MRCILHQGGATKLSGQFRRISLGRHAFSPQMHWLVRWVHIGLHQLPARMRKSARRREPHEFFNSLLVPLYRIRLFRKEWLFMTDVPARTQHRPTRGVAGRSFYDKEVQGIIWQIVVLASVLGLGWYLYSNLIHNLETRQIQTGWDFLWRSSSFDIGESMIEYSAASPYWKALLVGLLNTLRVAIAGCILATIIGVFVGVASLS